MDWFLPRGYAFAANNRIKKKIAEGEGWQIFLTNLNFYALVAMEHLCNRWIESGLLPAGVLLRTSDSFYQYLLSSSDYLIASLAQGPFPENEGQVQAFSHAFKTTLDHNPDIDLHDGIYLEEYSVILPVVFADSYNDNGIAYGKWLTGGINISIEEINRVSKIVSWLPEKSIVDAAKRAGFEKKEKQFSLVGRPELEAFFNENIIEIVQNLEQYQRMGITFPGATILYGPPGCGKTYAVERLIEYLGWPRFDIDSSTIASSYIHDTSKKISEVFRSAIQAAPSVVVIDEMEAFLSDRAQAGPSGMHHVEEVAEFLRRIPETTEKGVLIFAMTNMIDAIDPAILRRGRFDHIVEVKMASAEEISALLKEKFKELPVDESVDIAKIANDLAGHPMSDIAFVLKEAGRFAVKRKLDVINAECFADAMNLFPKKKEKVKMGFIK